MERVYLFSACLLGVHCRFDGGTSRKAAVEKLFREWGGLVVCPEELGGLGTPRDRAFLITQEDGIKIVTEKGRDVTASFEKGSQLAASMAKQSGVTHAVLKEKSPSCGVKKVHTDKGLDDGCGVATRALFALGITVLSDEDI